MRAGLNVNMTRAAARNSGSHRRIWQRLLRTTRNVQEQHVLVIILKCPQFSPPPLFVTNPIDGIIQREIHQKPGKIKIKILISVWSKGVSYLNSRRTNKTILVLIGLGPRHMSNWSVTQLLLWHLSTITSLTGSCCCHCRFLVKATLANWEC